MTTADITLDIKTFNQIKLFGKKKGFAYVGDYVENVALGSNSQQISTLELDKLLQAGLDSKSNIADESFWKKLEKKLGVKR